MNIVILTGAGISAESGLGTFRDSGGLWEKFRIEDVATPEAWAKNPALVLDFYNERRKRNNTAKPNKAHFALAELAKYHTVSIVTQNIDDLHERAGSPNVLHLHGEIMKGKTSELSTDYVLLTDEIELGDLYKGKQLRPHVVWFGESVPMMDEAEALTEAADLLIVIGTSLKVYPAAGLVNLVDVNCQLIIVDPNADELEMPNAVLISEVASMAIPKLVNELIK
jgi:NAD-dependent deacetylase